MQLDKWLSTARYDDDNPLEKSLVTSTDKLKHTDLRQIWKHSTNAASKPVFST